MGAVSVIMRNAFAKRLRNYWQLKTKSTAYFRLILQYITCYKYVDNIKY